VKAFTVTPEMKAEFVKLRAEGLSYRQVAAKTGVANSTVEYHCNEKYKARVKRYTKAYEEKARLDPEECRKRREYMRGYMNRRYHEDVVFRDKIRKANRDCAAKRREIRQNILAEYISDLIMAAQLFGMVLAVVVLMLGFGFMWSVWSWLWQRTR
jgi:hypothetical protein